MSDPTIERPLTIGDLLDDASLWTKGTVVRMANCLDNARILVWQPTHEVAVGDRPRIVGPTLKRFCDEVTVERLRHVKNWGERMTEQLRAALESKGYRLRDRAEVSARTIRSWMESAERIAGMPRQTGAMHVLRHTFGARLAMQGAPAKAIMELMGHRSMATTMRYMHLSPAARETAIRLLEGDGGAGNTAGNPTATR